MSTRTARRRLRLIAVAVSAVALATPATAGAMPDIRGEFAKSTTGAPQVSAGTDLRGEFAQAGGSTETTAPGADVRGEFAKSDYRADTPPASIAPAVDFEPAGSPSELPYVVSGIVLLLGLVGIALAVPMRRRLRVGH